MNKLEHDEPNKIVNALVKNNLIVIDGSKVHYKLTSDEPS